MLERDDRFAGWHRPAGWAIVSVSVCRGCREPISWARTPAGRTAPLDRDGGSHFATCPEADRFRLARSRQPRVIGR
jgi:hypothetical protein